MMMAAGALRESYQYPLVITGFRHWGENKRFNPFHVELVRI